MPKALEPNAANFERKIQRSGKRQDPRGSSPAGPLGLVGVSETAGAARFAVTNAVSVSRELRTPAPPVSFVPLHGLSRTQLRGWRLPNVSPNALVCRGQPVPGVAAGMPGRLDSWVPLAPIRFRAPMDGGQFPLRGRAPGTDKIVRETRSRSKRPCGAFVQRPVRGQFFRCTAGYGWLAAR